NKLLQSAPKNTFKQMSHIDSIIYYDSSKQAESFKLANQLRNNHLSVLVHPITQLDSINEPTKNIIKYLNNKQTINKKNKEHTFKNAPEVIDLLTHVEED